MKANEAPKSIYLSQEKDEDGCYVDLMWHKHPYEDKENIQYVRTDAFVEKACSWLKEIFSDYENLTDYNPTEDFKSYMKEE